MRRILVVLLVLAGASWGRDLPDRNLAGKAFSDSGVSRETWVTFAVFGAEVVADGGITRVLYQRHYDEIDPVAKPFVHAGVPGQVGASLLGAGAMGGVWWMLHRTHHDRLARQFLRSVTAAEGGNVGRQYSILRTSRK